jgi:hypothetical protein
VEHPFEKRGERSMKPTELKIIWREWNQPPSEGFGHGVEFHDTTVHGRDQSIVAFLDGFAWLHGISDEAVIYCIKPNTRTPRDVLSTMKKRVEKILSKRGVPNGQITDRIRAWVNG